MQVASQALGEVPGELGSAHRLDVRHAGGPGRPGRVPVAEHLEHRVHQRLGDRSVLRVRAEQLPQHLAVAEVGQPAHGAAVVGGLGDLALQLDAEVGQRRRPHLARRDRHAGSLEPLTGLLDGGSGDLEGQLEAGAVVAAPAVHRTGGVVELFAEEPHPAAVGGDVGQHRGLLVAPGRGHPVVALLVVGPLLAGGRPAAAHPDDSAIDVEHLQHRLEPGPAEVDVRLECGRRHRRAVLGQGPQGVADVLLRREGERGEVAPDVAVLLGRHQHDLGEVRPAAGAADLLVVGDR